MSSPTKTRLPAAARRASIVDTAIELFSRRGFRATTTRELAAACGVSEPVLYQHFETKRALYDAILESQAVHDDGGILECQLSAATQEGDSAKFFGMLGAALLEWYTNDPRHARLLMFAALEGHELSELFFQRKVVCFYDLIITHVRRQVEAGRFRPIDPLLAARIFSGTIAHQGIVFAIYCPGFLPAPKEEIVRNAVAIFLKGISTE